MAATPRIPLRELHELGRLVEAGVAGESPCDLLAATANAVNAALKSENHRDGWLFGQRDFIEAVRAIRDINAGGAVETYGATWAERWKALWSGLREALAAYARAAGCEPRAPRLVIEADSISRDWNRPLDTGALTSLFDYCKAAAVTAFREEREVVGFRYDSGVYDVPLANHRGIARLETHAERLHKEHGDILETLQEIKATTRATDGKVDALIGRDADNEVKPPCMAQIITAALAKKGNHKGIGGREVQRWVQYLKTGGVRGIQPPEGFTLNTLRTLAAAGAFAEQFADAEAGRLRTHMAFNEHDSRLEDRAKRRFDEEQEAMQKRIDRK